MNAPLKLKKMYLKVKTFFNKNCCTLSSAQLAITTGVSTATAMAFASAGNIPMAIAVGTFAGFSVISGGITIDKATRKS